MQNSAETAISEELQRQIVATVARHLAGWHYRLYLFGSRTQGRSTPHSDYDLGLLPERPIELAILARIRDELEALPILQMVDLLDLHNASPELIRSALNEGELLDEQ